MNKIFPYFSMIILVSTLHASEFIVKELSRDENKTTTWIVLPYAFSSDTTGLTGGVVGIFHGFFQPQMTIVTTLFRGEKLPVQALNPGGTVVEEEAYSKGGVLAVSGVRVPYTERLFFSYLGMRAYYPNQRLYINGHNDSLQDLEPNNGDGTPIQTQGWNNWSYVDLRYILPLGRSEKEALPTIETMRGLPVNNEAVGGGFPFATGQTIIGIKPFYQLWTADKLHPDAQVASNGLKFYLEHDNTDYPDNPSQGYSFSLQYAQDFGEGESTQKWNSIEGKYAHYFNLPDLTYTRQNVIALNLWSAYSPSWDHNSPYVNDKGEESDFFYKGQPPMWEGARLGGFDRMRAYDANRFHDKAAIYGALEYRVIPQLNPMRDQEWNPIPIMWFQGVLFAEAGRVAPQYNLELFEDMKYDVGFSIRALAATVPVRFEMAFGSEGSTMWVMLKQPF